MELKKEGKQKRISDLWYFCILGAILAVMFVFGQELEWNYREFIIGFVIVIGLFTVLGIELWKNIELYKFAFLFIIVVGSLSLLIQPILNLPDENVHFARAELVSRGKIIMDTKQVEYETIQSVLDLKDNVRKSYVSSSVKGKEIDYSAIKVEHVAASNNSFLYFPQAIGILIAKSLHLDVIWMLWLARFMNLLCYAFIIGYAVKITPKLQFPLFFLAVFPMCIQQAASCNPDAIINSSAILLVAYFLYLYESAEETITWKQMGIYLGLSIIVTLSKITNIFMAGLILLVPLGKYSHKKSAVFMKCMVIGSVIGIGGAYYFYTTLFSANSDSLQYTQENYVNSSEQIYYILTNFKEWFRNFGFALIWNAESYIMHLGRFGWMDYGNPLIPMFTMTMFGKICVQEQGVRINRGNKVLISMMILGIYCAVCLALYLAWTPVGSDTILGVQGRYFIPMCALVILLFASSEKDMSIGRTYTGDMIAMLGMNGAMLIATALRYY